MKSFFILFLYSSFAHAIDVGNGSDGACTAVRLNADLKRTYQCKTLIVNAPVNLNGAGGDYLLIKVQGLVQIDSTINLNGIDGVAGASSSGKNGGAGGPGGGNGGNSQLPPADGLNGTGFSPGIKGQHVPQNGSGDAYGGGGGGGSFVAIKSAIEPDDGFDSTGFPLNKQGANGLTVIADASYFDSTFTGGSGGAGGGGGFDDANTLDVSGSSGGGGGGAIRIVSGGSVIVSGTGAIFTNGGKGGGVLGVTSFSGSGGGGSGGAIWIQAAGTLTINGTLNAKGAIGGGNDFNLVGGNGGNGGIRLDSGGALDTTGSTIDPVGPYHTSFSPTPLEIAPRQYSSSISCAKVSEQFNHNYLINIIFGFAIAALAHLAASSKKRKV